MNHKKALNNPIFQIISEAAEELRVDAYVIGGFVRDYFLNRHSSAIDIDIVAIGSGITLAKHVSSKLPHKPKVQVFKSYGTAMLRYNDIEIEFVGARKESYNRTSRNPIVEMAPWMTIKKGVTSQSMPWLSIYHPLVLVNC